ncbi:hypothetical protein MIMGU_mgv1a013513mg [Erythranthe guttata]|uniref:Uncharacterized protein n=1 Tax=Erythranthe guttata TaxID=4155 RepID=A0A022Q3V0_ERYGU|nr:hypothetical protein MIMGU_mgv1a013513mg [Erythranthe guttata]
MGDGPRGIEVLPDYFVASTSGSDTLPVQTSSAINLSLKGLSWRLGANGQDKVVLSVVEVESLRSEIAALEERESHFKAQLEHIDEILRSARLSGYLFLRTRWAALPGESLPIDDTEVDDWLPRFIVLHGSCIYLYMISTGTRLFNSLGFPYLYNFFHLHVIIREIINSNFAIVS